MTRTKSVLLGLLAVLALLTPQLIPAKADAMGYILGTFYDGTDTNGPSFSVQGADCNGGGLNIPLSWNDRIGSMYTGCYRVTLYEHTNFGGAQYSCTAPACGNFGYMNNKASSIRFFAS